MAGHSELDAFALRVREVGDIAGMCRIGLYNEHRAGQQAIARRWLTLAAERGYVPALHELVRIDAVERRYDDVHRHLRQISAALEDASPTRASAPLGPASPPSGQIDIDWVLGSDWPGSPTWVSIGPQALGRNFYGQSIAFEADDVSITGEVVAVMTDEWVRATPLLNSFAEETVMRIDWKGDLVDFEDPGRPHIAYATPTDYGVRIEFDAKGEVGSSQARAIIRAAAALLTSERIAAHITGEQPLLRHLGLVTS